MHFSGHWKQRSRASEPGWGKCTDSGVGAPTSSAYKIWRLGGGFFGFLGLDRAFEWMDGHRMD